jgi:CheY-like chemotaxis protein
LNGSPRVLVVDGSKSIRELLRLHLSNAGYDVIVAEDAIVAGKEVLARAPDLIIVEVDLPYMNGIEFVAALKADGTIPEIPVILLSASGDVAQHAQRIRAVAHLSKPVSADRLLHVVALHAGQAGQGP